MLRAMSDRTETTVPRPMGRMGTYSLCWGLIPVFRTGRSENRTAPQSVRFYPFGVLSPWRFALEKDHDKIVESELRGVTLRVYWHILGSKNRSVGVRPVQRALGLSSPSVAMHHLEKLRMLGLLEKDSTGEYHLIEQVKVGVLQNFVGVLGFMLPRYLFYSTMFTVMLALYPIIYRPDFSIHNIMAFAFGISAVAVSWRETWRAWRSRPF